MIEISVIMSVYNGEKYLAEAINSILDQTYTDFEFIICNDASTDNTQNILDEYEKKDTRIKLLINEKNLGLPRSLNMCIEVATGNYIARMDADDISKKERFAVQRDFLEKNQEYALVGAFMECFDENGVYGTDKRPQNPDKTKVFLHKGFAHATIMIRKNSLLAVDNYSTDKSVLRVEDYDLWCKLYYNGYIGYNIQQSYYLVRVDRDAYARRVYKYRINEYNLRKYWFKALCIDKKYKKFIVKPLIAGLIPGKLMQKYHKKVWSR